MPKIHGTRKDRARELLRQVTLGPAFSSVLGEPFTARDAALQYKRWVEAWVLPELQALLPELRRQA